MNTRLIITILHHTLTMLDTFFTYYITIYLFGYHTTFYFALSSNMLVKVIYILL